MKKNISKKDSDIIAVHNGVFYEYHDESWHEQESWSTDDELEGDRLINRELYKDTNGLKSFPKSIIATSELPRVTPRIEALMKRLISIPFSTENKEEDITKES